MCAIDMNVMLTNLMIPAKAAAPSGKVAPKPKRSPSSKADKTASPEAKSAQTGKSARKAANSKDAPNTAKKSKAQSGPKAPGGKAAKVNKGEKVVVEALGSGQVFSEIIQSAKVSGNHQKVVAGELAAKVLTLGAKALTKEEAGNPDVVLAGKAQTVKVGADSLQVRAFILGKTHVVPVVPATNKPVPEGQAMVASEVGRNSVGEMPLDAEPAALPSRTPIKITEALAEAISSGIGAEKAGKSQVGLEAPEMNQQVLTSPAGPVLSALVERMKQVPEAPRVQAPVAGEKSTLAAPSVTGRKAVSRAGLVPNVSAEAVDKMDAGIKINTLLRDSGGPVAVVGQRSAGRSETSQEVIQHISTATEPVHVDTADTPAVSSSPENSLPAPAANQIVEALRASAERGGQQVVIRLNPPELGKVSVTLNANGSEVRGMLKVENPDTLSQLQREAPALLGRLAEMGIQLKQMDLSLSQQGTNDSSLYSQLRDESGLWQGGGQGYDPQTSASEFAPDEPVLAGAEEILPGAVALTDGAINIWI